MSHGRDEGWLRAWCAKLSLPANDFQRLLPLSSTYILLTLKEYEAEANLLLTQASEQRRTGETKTNIVTGKVKKDKWSYEDYCGVLSDIVNGSGSVGVAESVWNSFQLQKPKKARTGRFARRQQAGDEEIDSHLFLLLCSTMRYKQTDMFHFLAHSASQDVVNRMLPTALEMHSQRYTQILLEENGDPNTCSEKFLDMVRAGDEEFVRLLLQAQTPIELATLTSALPDAVQRGSAPIVELLLAHGADANALDGDAIERAILAKRTDLALLLLMGPNPPLPETLAPIVSYVFFKMEALEEKKYTLIELLLNGGAAGEPVSLALGGAVRQRWIKLVELFVDKGVSVNLYGAEGYRHAVHEVDLEMARILSRGNLDNDLATELFGEIDKTKYGNSIFHDKWRALAEVLLDQGAAGELVDEALVSRVQKSDLASVKLLLREGASVDYSNAAALDHAVASENEEFIDAILQYQPSPQSLNTVFNRVERLSPDVKHHITRKLLDAGANGFAVDRILKIAMITPTVGDRELIQILVDGGADVSQEKGYLLHLAVGASDDDTLEVLLLGFPSATVLSTCIPIAMSLSEGHKYKIIHMLLHAGARGDEVSQALIDSIDDTAAGVKLATLLLTTGEANTGFENGKALKKAIVSTNIDFLELLVQYDHLQEFDFCAALLVAIDLPQKDRSRLEKIRILLMSGHDFSGNTGTAALRHEMEGLKVRRETTIGVLHMLLEAGVNVNHKQGCIFIDAIEMDMFECYKLFLEAHPTFETLELAFEKALVFAFRTADLRYLQELLPIGMPQEILDKALLRAIDTTDEERNQELVLLLLRHGASINYQDGASVRKAVSRLDLGLLAHLLRHEPTSVTLNSGFALAMTLHDIRAKHDSYQLLLKAGPISQRLREEALVSAADGGWTQAAICELLLDHKASPNYATGTPMCRAIESSTYRVDLIRIFLRYSVTEEAIAAALDCAFDALQAETRLATMELLLAAYQPQLTIDQLLVKTVHAPTCDRKLLQCLLKANASVFHQGGECILHSVMANDAETLRLLEPHFRGRDGVSEIFMTVWGNGKRANSQQEEAVLSVLLAAGATGEPVSMALLETIKTVASTPAGFAFIANLLKAGADVNYNEGASLIEAATRGNGRLIKELLVYGPRRTYMTIAFPLVFRSGIDAQTLSEIAVTFCSHMSAPDLTYEHPSCGPILWQLLQTYPNERELLQYLIGKGCTVDPMVRATLPLSPGEETVSLLCWAIANGKGVKDDVIEILASAGANVNWQSNVSQSTPLQLAIFSSRTKAVATLLHYNADPSLETNGISPLSLAASIGDSNISRLLVNAGAAPGDGALHEAARMVNVSVLQVLLIEGKQRDYACSRFQGRTALAELCMTAGAKPVSQLKAAMSLLKKNGDVKRKSKGRSILHFALDNPNAIAITQALLDVFMSEYINDDFNIFEEGRLRYSPLAYVSRGLNKAPPSQRSGLMDLLREFECRDRYWAAEGEQPPEMINPPEEITRALKTERARQARILEENEDHQRRLMHRRAETDQDLAALQARHDLALQNQRAIASETARIEHESATRQAGIASQRYDAEMAYMRQVTELANRRKDDAHTREIEHRRNLALLDKSQRDESWNVERQRREEEAAFVSRREKLLTSGYEDRARIDRDRYAEQMRLFEAQRGIMEINNRPRVVQQQQIEYSADSLD